MKKSEHGAYEDAHFNDGDAEEPEIGRLAASGYRLEGLMRLSFLSRDESCMMAGWRTTVLTVISF